MIAPRAGSREITMTTVSKYGAADTEAQPERRQRQDEHDFETSGDVFEESGLYPSGRPSRASLRIRLALCTNTRESYLSLSGMEKVGLTVRVDVRVSILLA